MAAAFEDDSAGFDRVERAYIREELVPDFEWLEFERPSPRCRLSVALADARIGLVTTAGAHLPTQRPMGPSGRARLVPVDADDVALTHEGYDVERASEDPNVVYPVRTLRALVREGIIGSLAPTAISTMGYCPDGHLMLERSVPPMVDRLRSEGVDLALLVPA